MLRKFQSMDRGTREIKNDYLVLRDLNFPEISVISTDNFDFPRVLHQKILAHERKFYWLVS